MTHSALPAPAAPFFSRCKAKKQAKIVKPIAKKS